MGPPYGKLPILFPYLKGFEHGSGIREEYGSRLPLLGVPLLLGVPGITLDILKKNTHWKGR